MNRFLEWSGLVVLVIVVSVIMGAAFWLLLLGILIAVKDHWSVKKKRTEENRREQNRREEIRKSESKPEIDYYL
jgi:hypothetical protein